MFLAGLLFIPILFRPIWGIYLMFLFLPMEASFTYGVGTGAVTLIRYIGIMTTISVIAGIILKRKQGHFNLLINRQYIILFWLLFIWILFSGYWAPDQIFADIKAQSYFSNFVFVFLIVYLIDSMAKYKLVLFSLLLGCFIVFWFGFNEYILSSGLARVEGLGQSANGFGQLNALAFTLTTFYYNNNKGLKKWLGLLLLLIFISGVILSGSRTLVLI